MKYYAHTKENEPPEKWQTLDEHLENTAKLAAEFAKAFNAEEWGRTAGMLHDVGKATIQFQEYLKGEAPSGGNHSTPGAIYATEKFPILGHIAAFVIAGHHSGLLDAISDGASMQKRLQTDINISNNFLNSISINSELPPPETLKKMNPFATAMFTKMLFSSLVDADFIDTESFMQPEKKDLRSTQYIAFSKLYEHLIKFIQNKLATKVTKVNSIRAEILNACVNNAEEKPGFFSLTVPTGGGKTLSSLAFALKHADIYNKSRIIYVIPFTSIIEQNASVFRDIFKDISDDIILEHHSNFVSTNADAIDNYDEKTIKYQLASENWDSQIVVTTAVQFYESLFANRTSKCRKLHNIANSVIILDEAQSIPVKYIKPILSLLNNLVDFFNCTIVLCTATQPEIIKSKDFSIGIEKEKIREIIPDRKQLYINLKRVETEYLGEYCDIELVNRLISCEKALCIVNTRKHAKKLFDLLKKTDYNKNIYHLSALMCPAHRSTILNQVKVILNSNEPCILISTQLIEAGVDIDFPFVFRSMAGIDSIVQAAGRCNRNGKLPDYGKLFIFKPEDSKSENFFAETTNCGSQVIECHQEDILSLDAVKQYFKLYYWEQSNKWDSTHILDDFSLANNPKLPLLFHFKTVAEKFKIINDYQKAIIIPWNEKGRELSEKARKEHPNKALSRALQRYSVNINEWIWNQQLNISFTLEQEQYPILVSPEMNYSEETGLFFEDDEQTNNAFFA